MGLKRRLRVVVNIFRRPGQTRTFSSPGSSMGSPSSVGDGAFGAADGDLGGAEGLYLAVVADRTGDDFDARHGVFEQGTAVHDGDVKEAVAYRGRGGDESVVAVLRGVAAHDEEGAVGHDGVVGDDLVGVGVVLDKFVDGAGDVRG